MRTLYENIFLIIVITIFISMLYLFVQKFSIYEGATTGADTSTATATETSKPSSSENQYIKLVQNSNSNSTEFNIPARQTDIDMANVYVKQLDDLIQKFSEILSLAKPENNSIQIGSVSMGDTCSAVNVCPSPIITVSNDPPNQLLNFVLPKGPQGIPGTSGEKGPKGLKGVLGERGPPGSSCSTPLQ